MCQVKNGCIAA